MASANQRPNPKTRDNARDERASVPSNAVKATPARGVAASRSSEVSRETTPPKQPRRSGNTIQADRSRSTETSPPPADLPAAAGEAAESSAVPEHIRQRFIQVGNRYYFPNGDKAFRDRGGRLSTQLENTEVIRSLLEIAQARGWQRITVTGSERFRKEAWQQAKLAGLAVRGYRPSEVERAQLVRMMDRERNQAPDPSRLTELATERAESPRQPSESPAGAARAQPEERVVRGRLLDHGPANYRFDRNEPMSYYMKVDTPSGERTVWGRDLERAVKTSLSQVKAGDEVAVRHLGEKPVTVVRAARDDEGRVIGKAEVAAYRNRWLIEKQEFLEQRAQLARVVRDPSVDPKTATRQRPELVGTYLELRAAELVAKDVYPDVRDQQQFVTRVREAIASEIERGESLSAVRVREAARRPEATRVRTAELQTARTLS